MLKLSNETCEKRLRNEVAYFKHEWPMQTNINIQCFLNLDEITFLS